MDPPSATVTSLNILFRDSTPPETYQNAIWGRVFNHLRDYSRVPFAVCRPKAVSQVIDAVNLAIQLNRKISIRSGGHSWAAWSVRHDALLIDLVDLDADVELSPPPPPPPPATALDTSGVNMTTAGTGSFSSSGLPGERFISAVGGSMNGGQRRSGGRIDYDAQTKIVSCPPATTGRMLNGFLATVENGQGGRMFMGGHCPDVGLGGFLLQGGMGWNCKNWGWACESIAAIDVVTADGRFLHCSLTENADLFWLARGAGPGFPAIVTRFYLLTRPLLKMWHSLYVFPISEYRRVLQWEVDIAPTVDSSIEMVGVASYMALPPLGATFEEQKEGEASSLPPKDELEAEDSKLQLTILANFTTFQPTLKQAEAALLPIHNSVPGKARISLFCQPTSFEKEYLQQSKTYPQEWRYCSDNVYLSNDLSLSTSVAFPDHSSSSCSENDGNDANNGNGKNEGTGKGNGNGKQKSVVDVLSSAFTSLPTTKSTALWFSMTPTSRRPLGQSSPSPSPSPSPLPTPMALTTQSDHYVALYTAWEDPQEDGKYTGWVKDRIAEIEPHSTGSYLGDADFRQRFGTNLFWSQEAGQKIMELRKKWDPMDRICSFLVGDEGEREAEEMR